MAFGSGGAFNIVLNGDAPQYPYTVAFTVAGPGLGTLHDLAAGTATFTSGSEAWVSFNALPQGTSMPVQKLTVALKQESRAPSSLYAGEVNRRKEPLEAYPLDSMAMVGSVARGGRPTALLRVENLPYQVKVGDYLGQNFGKVVAITETEVKLREVVQDSAGEWIERPAALQLQER